MQNLCCMWVRTRIWLKAHSSYLGSCFPLCRFPPFLGFAGQNWLAQGCSRGRSGTEIILNKIDYVWEEKQVFILLFKWEGGSFKWRDSFPFNLVLEKCHSELFNLRKQIPSSGFLAGICSQCHVSLSTGKIAHSSYSCAKRDFCIPVPQAACLLNTPKGMKSGKIQKRERYSWCLLIKLKRISWWQKNLT